METFDEIINEFEKIIYDHKSECEGRIDFLEAKIAELKKVDQPSSNKTASDRLFKCRDCDISFAAKSDLKKPFFGCSSQVIFLQSLWSNI